MDKMRDVGEEVAETRKEKGWTQRELAQKLYVSDKNVSKWECGRSVPDVFTLKRIADLFGVDLDYFVKLEGDADFMTDVGIKIRSCRELAGYSQAEFAERLRTSEKEVVEWERGEALPDVFYLNKMSEFFDFPLEDLIGFEAMEQTDENVKRRTRAGKICLTLLLVLALMPLLVAVIARIFLPATIPAHYDGAGEITRWGSSKELLIAGGSYFLIVAGGGLALYLALVRTHYSEAKAWIVWLSGAVFAAVAIVVTAISVGIVKKDYAACIEAGMQLPVHSKFNELFSVTVCALYALCGAICIFIPKNGFIGVRIPYSFVGKKEWAFVNAFTGAIMYACSVGMIILTGVLDFPVNLGFVCAAIFVPVVVMLGAAFASVALHKRIKANKKKERELFGQ